MSQNKLLLTTALIYANGELHLGHLVENIRADIYKRYHKLRGRDCLLIGGSDCHGTPIMLNAEKHGMSPEQLIQQSHESQAEDLKGFAIDFDNFYLTHSTENKALSSEFFLKLEKKGLIETKTIRQAFDEVKQMFLPDRFIKGECPKCHAKDQYGDGCEVCGTTYDPSDLITPRSVLSDSTPIEKETEHLFFKLPAMAESLKKWLDNEHVPKQLVNKLSEWFDAGLKNWDISRDAPYFGFEIPNHANKYFYVWLDAPIGYLASLENFCQQHPQYSLNEFWAQDSQAEVQHFIGKDIVYFHALFWPAVLMAADKRTPNKINVNGFLTINGEKLSKSRGNFINAKHYLKHLSPTYLRYYFAAKLNNHIEDFDFNIEDFKQRVNADLIGKYVNIASRCAGFIKKHFNEKLSTTLDNPELLHTFREAGVELEQFYEDLQFSHAMRKIMELADMANQYIAEHAPWSLIKIDGKQEQVHHICTTALNLFRLLSIYLKPVIPRVVQAVESFLNIEPLCWDDLHKSLLDHKINKFKPLLSRIEQSQIDELLV